MRFRLEAPNVITALVGLMFMAGGVYAYHYLGRSLQQMREAPGVVVDIVYETGTMQKGRKHPVVRFRTANGIEVTATSEKHRAVERGDAVPVVYDPRNPTLIEVTTLTNVQRQRVFSSGFAIVLGLVLSLGAASRDLGAFQKTPAGREPDAGRAPAGAVPPLDYQVRAVPVIVLATTEVSAEAASYRVQEVWKAPLESIRAGDSLRPDTRMHALLGYRPLAGQQVVMFFLDARASRLLELLPVVDGRVLYAPNDPSVQEKLTPGELRDRARKTN